MDNIRGMAWMTLAMLGFALADMFIKFASETLPVGQILAMFGLGGALVFGILAKREGVRLISPVLLMRPVIIRNLSEMGATIGVVTAIALIPFSTFSAIIQANPLLVTLGAALFLGEPVGWRRWTAIFVGLIGVMIIIRPGLEGFDANVWFAVMGVVFLSARDLATRPVPTTISTAQLSTYSMAAIIPAGLGLLAFSGGAAWPSPIIWGAMLGAIVMGLVAYFSITKAMRVGEISAVTPFRYTRLIFALIIALVIFGERPDAWTLIGAAIVIATGLYSFAREARLRAR
ncbi:EamA family transporter [Roseobacter sp. HKCCD9010]|uniref:DMT family transporter n=2 Tax=unclassified Roseobacter TaxID=196798 RepID=UPI0014917D54|nr:MULTISPECIES: DMT family transporter [unclassified Roseobacter]MBF9050067.1 EamA family transporter [Rhodobacterales bacterium HKCCD4356]NNV12310.1 EamA family transporter [Roseobacter sp. HKCCD7357]NNV16227.1 EamA family transporter [Roseobacter sp. HKCCD8768]NNV25687.1 EamA family transporter [Roseobacter sp. HKCCD8192]NNV29943.1 EamA family transporter [Roseobacter sp. HKCCD9061]